MKNKNQRIWSSDREFLQRLADEQKEYIGRPFKLELDKGLLTIFALPPVKHKKKVEHKDKEPRNKHAESAGRRSRD